MNKSIRPAIYLLLLTIGLAGCEDNLSDRSDKYKRPDWLEGKLFTQVNATDELSTFARCIELTGFDSIIDVSGSFTVFAPTNEAFTAFFQDHPIYNRLEDIPESELVDIVSYHIVQNPWTKRQLMSLDVHGWIDSLDQNNNLPRGFKRETLLRKEDLVLGVKRSGNRTTIVDKDQTTWERRVINNRKFAPIFFRQYFDIYNLNVDDYEFYFDRPLEGGDNIYYAGAKVIGDEIFAENGFIYKLDKVVEPLKNAHEIMATQNSGNNYKDFYDFINQFPVFTYNQQATFRQPGASEGLQVDSLFDLTYPQLAFDIASERTKAPAGTVGLPANVSIRYHHGLVAPTNEAFAQFINEYLVGPNRWGSLEAAPVHMRRIIANTHMSVNTIFPTDLTEGFYNGENDIVNVNPGSIVHKEFGSNSTFIGVNEAVVPRAFSSVTGPVYLQRGYSRMMNAIEFSGLLPTLKRRNQEYLLFVESDASLTADSSLVHNPTTNAWTTWLITMGSQQGFNVNRRDLRTLILNHIGTALPKGVARKEFIPNLAGNYLIFNNETGEVSGTAPTSIGYNGLELKPNFPSQISTNADNGITYDIENWFSFSSGDIYSLISTNYQHFHGLMVKAGLARTAEFRYTFVSDNEVYTIFIPTPEALESAGANEMTGSELSNFLMSHFIQGDVIFTDGNKSPGYYMTSRIDESSTTFNVVYTSIFIEPGIDVIDFPGNTGSNYLRVNESGATNLAATRTIVEGTTQPAFENLVNQAVIHEIDKAFVMEDMNTK